MLAVGALDITSSPWQGELRIHGSGIKGPGTAVKGMLPFRVGEFPAFNKARPAARIANAFIC
jgi:hypothetical protein